MTAESASSSPKGRAPGNRPAPAEGARAAFLLAAILAAALGALAFSPGRGPGSPLDAPAARSAPGGRGSRAVTYALMAASMAADGDLRFTRADLERGFALGHGGGPEVQLASGDGFRTATFGLPAAWPLAAAPAFALGGERGIVAWNAVLLAALVALAAARLRRGRADGGEARATGGMPLVLGAAFVLLGSLPLAALTTGSSVFVVFLVAASLHLAIDGGRAGLAGLVLAAAVCDRPLLALLAIPVVLGGPRGRRLAHGMLAAVGLGFGLALLAVAARTMGAPPHPLLAAERIDARLTDPARLPFAHAEPPPGFVPPPAASRWPASVPLATAGARAREALLGRTEGALVCRPMALVGVLLGAAAGFRRRGAGLVLAAVALGAWLELATGPDLGAAVSGASGEDGRGPILALLPASLFLFEGTGPFVLAAAGAVLAAALAGPRVLASAESPLAATLVPEARLADRLPGHVLLRLGGLACRAPSGLSEAHGDELWVAGAERVTLWLTSEAPLDDLVLRVRSIAPGNVVRLRSGRSRAKLAFTSAGGEGETREVKLDRLAPFRVRAAAGGLLHEYRLEVAAERGEPPRARGPGEEGFPLGAALLFLGSEADVKAPVYAVEWLPTELPAEAAAGRDFRVLVRCRNASPSRWRGSSLPGVSLSYHWVGLDGKDVVREGRRQPIGRDVEPGGYVALPLAVRAPDEPGRYALEIEPVFEHVAWFSDHGGKPLRGEVLVRGRARSEEEGAE